MRSNRSSVALATVLVTAAAVVAGCGGASDSTSDSAAGGSSSGSSASKTKLALVAYSTPKQVFSRAIPAFNKTAAGEGVGFSQSYGASGDQSRAVENGQPADVVEFSLQPDVTRLVKSGQVAEDWNKNEYDGFVSHSLVSFIVRKGNPKGIKTWDDLLEPGVQVVTPNPFSSGSAKWNLLAPYATYSEGGKNPKAGLDYLTKLITQHVKVQPKSGREATQTFTQGTGDVLLSYENEAITARKAGEDVDYVTPDLTFLIQNPIAVLKDSKSATQAKAFVDFLYSDAGQKIFAEEGYRPVVSSVEEQFASQFPNPKKVWSIDDLGGWSKVNDELFDPDKGDVAKIEEKAGVGTDG